MQFTSFTFPLLLFALTKENAFANAVCEDSTTEFFMTSGKTKSTNKKTNKKRSSCAEAAENPKKFCQFPKVESNCPVTCDKCHHNLQQPTQTPSSKPSSKPSYFPFTSSHDLKEAVLEYCKDPGAWENNEKFDTHGPIEDWDVSQIINMNSLFEFQMNCNPNIAQWNVSQVTSFSWMFYQAFAFNGDISQWDTSSGIDFYFMFSFASAFNGDISEWDISSATDLHYMFSFASAFNANISQWDTSSATDLNYMFNNASRFDQDLCTWQMNSNDPFFTMEEFCTGAISCGNCLV